MRLKLVVICLAFNLMGVLPSHGQTPNFQGKTMTIVVGTVAGDLYDLYARAIALFMGKYLPGNPNIIVQNMPGAGHMIAANYVYNVAKPDGLTLGAINAGLYFEQLIGRAEVKFDWTKFNWIGNATKSPQVLYMRADAPFKSIEDVRNAKEAPKCGTTGMSNMGYFVPKLLEETVGAKFNVIAGYQGGNEIDLGVERGEIVCRSLSTEAYFSREPFLTWRKNGFSRELTQGGKVRLEKLANVPTVYELMDKYKTPDTGRRLATALLASGEFHRPYMAPPKMRAEIVKALRDAFTKTMKDPDFLAETKRKRLDMDPTTGEEVQALAADVMTQPKDVVDKLKNMMGR
ncbi:MAG TPA: tripartite tricarboxylate transporter substrate-binding protein [Candidatus Limnocylindrales bacterium]|nr:tripartite tricarboxylate transporter substrate-binding protein [Candidatus Limnocylindrales bacterium]